MKNYFELWFNGVLEGKFLLKHDVQCRLRRLVKQYPSNWIQVIPFMNGKQGPAIYDSKNGGSIQEIL